MNCNTPPRIAHSGAQGMPIISNPTSHRSATARESWHWAINQFLSAVPVVCAWERQSCHSMRVVNHKGHEETQRWIKSNAFIHVPFGVLIRWMPGLCKSIRLVARNHYSNELSSCSFVPFVVKIKYEIWRHHLSRLQL